MKTIYLHVGNFKTGTSAIQEYCHRNRDALLAEGVDYLATARGSYPSNSRANHAKLSVSLSRKYNGPVPGWYIDNDPYHCIAESVRKSIDSSTCDTILISSEEFYRIPLIPGERGDRARQDLQHLFHDYEVRVIIYVREPFDFLKSWYNQINTKGRHPYRRFTDWFYAIDDVFLLPQVNVDFWEDCFGKNTVIATAYGSGKDSHIRKFLQLIDAESALRDEVAAHTVNPRKDESSLEIDRISRIMEVDNPKRRRALLVSHVLQSLDNFQKLESKVARINLEFAAFCRAWDLPMADATFTAIDLLVHEESVNRKDTPIEHFVPKRKTQYFSNWCKDKLRFLLRWLPR